MTDLLSLWGKSAPEKHLIAHSIDAGCCAEVLLQDSCSHVIVTRMAELLSLPPADIIPLVSYLTALHDIGKVHPFFQCKAPELICVQTLISQRRLPKTSPAVMFRHERQTSVALEQIWSDNALLTDDWCEVLCTVLSLHHQGKSGTDALIPQNCNKQWWETQQSNLELEMRTLFSPNLSALKNCLHMDAFATLLTGIVILSDWIASNSDFDSLSWTSCVTYRQAATLQAQKSIHTFGLSNITTLPPSKTFSDLWASFTPETLRPMQKICQNEIDTPASLYILEAPMGEGKTECALYLANAMCHAHGLKGIYFALPTMATSNQMYARFNTLLKENHLPTSRLLHAMAWLVDLTTPNIQTEESQQVTAWLAPLRRGLLTNYAVGTVDQAMMAVLKAKYTVLRLIGLSSKVLIIDEIHAYDTYMSQILDRLLSWCHALKIPVILLSATLPSARKANLLQAYGASASIENHYPLLTAVHGSGAVTQQTCSTYMQPTFHFSLLAEDNLRDSVFSHWSEQGGCLCVLTNTVGKAQSLFGELLAQGVPRDELLLFHARFTAQNRQRLEQQCISLFGKDGKRPKRFIVIGTQVLEQSLDVDFDAMFTEIAPIDLLLQRAGRVFRHQKTNRPDTYTRPNIFVFHPDQADFGVSSKIYEPLLLHRTKSFLESAPKITVPNDMRNAIESVYIETLSAEELALGMEMQFKNQMSQNMAEGVILTPPNPHYFFATETASPFSLFTQEDQDSTLASIAKTRQGEESVTAAFLSPTLFSTACCEKPSKEIARQVLLHSVSLRRFPLESILPQAAQGQGTLNHSYLFCLAEGQTIESTQCTLRNDTDLGIVIERK